MSFAKMFRTSCTECGSSRIRWIEATELPAYVSQDAQERAREMLTWYPSGSALEAWLCGPCGNFGVIETGMEGLH